MRSAWIFLCAVCVFCPVKGTHRSSSCACNGKALYCVRDSLGLRCANCQDNTEGRHCESCKEGYYHQRAGERCLPCYCNPVGSEGPGCDSQGQCVCKRGVQGAQCDRCANGSPVSATGCEPLQQKPCFCNGHSNECSPAQGYSVYNIISTFDQGMEGWRVVTAPSASPSQVQSRWSPAHHSVEVISSDILPVYLSAPAQYLGNQALSYGQTLSFTLRLNRGVRYPSASDVVLEGAGLKVSAPLGNMRTVIPCGKKITYTFRLDEQPSSRWNPRLSAPEFQTLLSNVTAIKIRVTFGEEGRGYLDDVTLVSARMGSGFPAPWVEKCHCPTGYEGQFCERCAAGYKRRFPGQGVRSQCEPCACRGGSCDPETGDCYSADETPSGQACGTGYYSDPEIPGACKKCPCPAGYICSLAAGTLNVKCKCPSATTGSRCQKCSDGFYGDPLGESGVQRPCQRCHCNGHLDLNAVGNCDRLTGECFKCMNSTTGFQCEKCVEGFFHSKAGDACRACNCNPKGSIASSCSDQGQCKCKEGFEGKKCVRSTCPSCFNPVKSQIGKYVKKLQQVEALFNEVGTGGVDITRAIDKAISTAEDMVKTVESDADSLIEAEKNLHAQLLAIGSNQMKEEGKIEDISEMVESVVSQERQYQREVTDIQKLISDIRQNLQKAKREIQSVELPLGDAPPGTNTVSDLVQKASDLAEKHVGEAATVEQTAKSSLLEAEKALALMRTVISGENKVTEQLNGLRTQYETDIAQVNAMNKQAARLSNAAETESTVALDTLKQISDLEKNLPKAPKKDITSLVATLDGLKNAFGSNVSGFLQLHNQAGADQREAVELMNQLRNAQQVQDHLLARANVAKADADKALKLFNSLGSVDEALETLKGFETQINSSKALADDALSKLPIISSIIGKAVVNNDKTQAILDQLGDYSDAQAILNKLNISLAKVEKMSGSLPSSSDLLKAATTLQGGLEGLDTQVQSTRNKLTEEKTDAERERKLAEEVNWEASGAYIKAQNTRDAVGDALKSVNNLLGLLGTPGAVDEKKVTDLEEAIATSRRRVETELRPRLRELEDKEAQQRAAITRMINDIDTILADIDNLEHINRAIPGGCYNTPPIERA
ncbi:laminin subunit gamma-2 [Pangasianodon hypophthalmus]|uniref:laminin subunit gamma-2 n=1 Tax=Pangasianodon hypophthalmus TaxID=310915 RepID=UPI002307EBD4|nr:laminin subunit gamma-2 [Pangasianodon hypophthalmus]